MILTESEFEKLERLIEQFPIDSSFRYDKPVTIHTVFYYYHSLQIHRKWYQSDIFINSSVDGPWWDVVRDYMKLMEDDLKERNKQKELELEKMLQKAKEVF